MQTASCLIYLQNLGIAQVLRVDLRERRTFPKPRKGSGQSGLITARWLKRRSRRFWIARAPHELSPLGGQFSPGALRHSTHSRCFLCHSSIDNSGYPSKHSSLGPICGSTQLALSRSSRCTLEGTLGNSVSIAEANGCTSSAHCSSLTQSGVPQRLQ